MATDTGSASVAWVGWRPGPALAGGEAPERAEPSGSAGSVCGGGASAPGNPKPTPRSLKEPVTWRSVSSKATTRRSTLAATASAPLASGSKRGGASIPSGLGLVGLAPSVGASDVAMTRFSPCGRRTSAVVISELP